MGERRVKAVLAVLATVVAAALAGAALTQPLLRWLMDRQAIHNGPWRASADTGSADANPYLRAAVAVGGLYALSKQEAIYFTAFDDSSGAALRGECRYQVSGAPPPARWWSITAYDADHFLVPNAAGVYARHADNLAMTKEGRFAFTLSADAKADGGLAIPAHGPFSLTLRLYNPAPEAIHQLATLPLPAITRLECP